VRAGLTKPQDWEGQTRVQITSFLPAILGCCCWAGILGAQPAGADERLERQAGREFDSAEYGAAARDLKAITERNPANISAQILLGFALFRQEKYADSVPAYEKALALEEAGRPLSTGQRRIVTDQLAMAYGISGHLGKARELLDEAIMRDPEYPLNYYNLACTFAEQGSKAKMLANLDLAFQRKSNVLKGEQMPDPVTDQSFQRYVRDPDFISLMRKLGLRPVGTPATGADK
jgi:tetratricopeptide (TPR) repeat protein